MNNILIIYNGWKIKKFNNGFAAVSAVLGRDIKISEYKKNLKDIFFYCDMIDLQIERDKIEGRCEV